MKILFLDCDGVLNTKYATTLLSLSKPKLKLLRQIIADTGCKLVLSSTWRLHEDAKAKLARAGLEFYGMTPRWHEVEELSPHEVKRGHEIQWWLDRHPEVERYCIVDDDSDMLDSQLRYFVQTEMEYGLTKGLAYRIIWKLKHGVEKIL